MKEVIKIRSISRLHEILGYTKPVHPLISLIDFSKITVDVTQSISKTILGFYSIIFKKFNFDDFKYGRMDYDFNEMSLLCMAPEQLTVIEGLEDPDFSEGWGLFFHPDLIRSSFLIDKISEYSFFSYDVNEALHLSEQENATLLSVLKIIEKEYSLNIDTFSTDLIISNIEVLLNYCKRFYGRQFITRRHANHTVVKKFEKLLVNYFDSQETHINGLPSVRQLAEKLHFSPKYLSDLLKQETGKSAIEHIHYHLIEKAKNLLLNSQESISEIAYQLGFEQAPSFSKLFKKKTGLSPKEYRLN